MNYINYHDSIKIVDNIEEKETIQCFIFRKKSCPFCDDWFKNNQKGFDELTKSDFEVYVIDTDVESIPFPPLVSPTLYFHHKKFKFPFIRQGLLPLQETKKELNKFVRIKNGETYESVFK